MAGCCREGGAVAGILRGESFSRRGSVSQSVSVECPKYPDPGSFVRSKGAQMSGPTSPAAMCQLPSGQGSGGRETCLVLTRLDMATGSDMARPGNCDA